MKIDGRLIASEIKKNLKEKISFLKSKHIIPHLAVVLIGNDPASQTYVKQKQKVGEELGIKVSLFRGIAEVKEFKKELFNLVNKLNHDKSIHGIIIQRPVPLDISKEELDLLALPQKDVDGFHPQSSFTPPIASAVLKILEWVFLNSPGRSLFGHLPGVSAEDTPGVAHRDSPGVEEISKDFIDWLKKQKILVIGRGETAGKPIAETLQKMGVTIEIAHSKTTNLKELCLTSDIIISCVGKRPILRLPDGSTQNGPYIVRRDMVLPSTLLIGVGLHSENGKLAADYDQEEIASKVAFYTPVPGGVGPVNVACLFENLINSLRK